jgi:hypothetical protein
VPEFFKAVGMTLVSKVGGASGSLYGTLFLDMGKNAPAGASMSAAEWAHALSAGVAAVVARGHAQPGDKTMIDAFGPALEALDTALSAVRHSPMRRRQRPRPLSRAARTPSRSWHGRVAPPIWVSAASVTWTRGRRRQRCCCEPSRMPPPGKPRDRVRRRLAQ